MRDFLDAYRESGYDFRSSIKADERYGQTSTFIQCIEAGAHSKSRLGRYVPLCLGLDKNRPGPDEIKRIAEAMRLSHERLYGGRWIVVEQATEAQMSDSRRRMIEERKRTDLVAAAPEQQPQRPLPNPPPIDEIPF
jgi:hypothetical protein